MMCVDGERKRRRIAEGVEDEEDEEEEAVNSRSRQLKQTHHRT
jgi:hypothetical protein